MGLFGMGRAFDLRFRPNGPLRTNIYHRPGPKMGPIPIGGNYSYTENINIQTTPGGFWGFMSGFLGGLTGGMGFGGFGMPGYGLSSMGGFAPLGGLFGNQSMLYNPNALSQSNTDTDVHLQNLTDFYGSKYTIKPHPDKKGVYQAVSKDGGTPIEGTYQELCDKLGTSVPAKPQEVKPEGTVQKTEEDKMKKDPNYSKLEKRDGKWYEKGTNNEWEWKDGKFVAKTSDNADPSDSDDPPRNDPVKPSRTTSAHGSLSSGSSKGWYRASNDKSAAVNQTHNPDGTGKTAQQITSAVLGTKLKGVLNAAQQQELCQIIIKKNPSVFQSNGEPKENADYNKLDVPTMAWIEEHFGLTHDSRTARHDDVLSSEQGTRTVTSKTGRYAKQINGQWHYFAKDGTELNETHIKKNDQDLWSQTHPNAGTLSYNHQQQGPLSNHMRS